MVIADEREDWLNNNEVAETQEEEEDSRIITLEAIIVFHFLEFSRAAFHKATRLVARCPSQGIHRQHNGHRIESVLSLCTCLCICSCPTSMPCHSISVRGPHASKLIVMPPHRPPPPPPPPPPVYRGSHSTARTSMSLELQHMSTMRRGGAIA